MRILLDTHSWLWMQAEPERFSAEVQAMLADADSEVFFSAASAWEIAIKHSLGKLPLPMPATEYVTSRMTSNEVSPLPIQHLHALRVASLPFHHRDPFDRLLIAQAQIEGLPILTADPLFRAYDVEIVRPR